MNGVRLIGPELYKALRRDCAKDTMGKPVKCPPVASMAHGVSSPLYQELQTKDFVDRLNQAINKYPNGYSYRISDYLQSPLGRATVLDQDVNWLGQSDVGQHERIVRPVFQPQSTSVTESCGLGGEQGFVRGQHFAGLRANSRYGEGKRGVGCAGALSTFGASIWECHLERLSVKTHEAACSVVSGRFPAHACYACRNYARDGHALVRSCKRSTAVHSALCIAWRSSSDL